jgi:hypothetical protein
MLRSGYVTYEIIMSFANPFLQQTWIIEFFFQYHKDSELHYIGASEFQGLIFTTYLCHQTAHVK